MTFILFINVKMPTFVELKIKRCITEGSGLVGEGGTIISLYEHLRTVFVSVIHIYAEDIGIFYIIFACFIKP